MNSRRICFAAIAVSFFVVSAATADTVILKGGHQVSGQVLKSDKNVVIVDLGVTVLRLPRSKVVRIEKSEEKTSKGKPEAKQKPPSEQKESAGWQMFRTALLQPTTIEDNAQRFGEAVVMVTSPGGQGSGFMITPDGYCITNYHVISGETRIKVTVFRRTKTGYEQKNYKKVKIIALNAFVDLALMKVDGEGDTFKYAYLGRTDELEAGQEVFAIGNPLGLTRTVSQGIVSTKNRYFQGRLYIQTTTAVNPGNSGGPLFNLKGEVIGVTSMGYIYLGGLNFAIPVDVVKRFVINRDAFAYDEDNPNSGYRYLQPAGRVNKKNPAAGKVPAVEAIQKEQAKEE
ncbi:MAG: trypsin-like peptidase domain-containing protein [Phycisphaerae bacterium]|nr:trypsin-like peptidase domain-containing protein [Phycisphaerae bacterium]